MKILIIGGTGNISWHCTEQSIKAGYETCILNRHLLSKGRPVPDKVRWICGDINTMESCENFDVIVDFLCYTPEQARQRVELFKGKCGQYIFISSAAVYYRPSYTLPYTENSIIYSMWDYASNKVKCEIVFCNARDKKNFPVVVVRPGHTYDTIIPTAVGNSDWTIPQRMIDGLPVVLHGDGTTLWTLTHSSDFAKALVGLFGNLKTIGQSYNITSDETLTWRSIYTNMALALGCKQPKIVYVPSEYISKVNSYLGNGIVYHKMWNDIYDNSKIKRMVPEWNAEVKFAQGIRKTFKWFMTDKKRQKVDNNMSVFLDSLCDKFGINAGGEK